MGIIVGFVLLRRKSLTFGRPILIALAVGVATTFVATLLAPAWTHADLGALGSIVDVDKEVDLALAGAQLGNNDVEVADWIALELALGWSLSHHIRQAGDTMALQAAMQRGACQMGDGWLKGIKAVIQWQQGVPPKGNDHGLFLEAENA